MTTLTEDADHPKDGYAYEGCDCERCARARITEPRTEAGRRLLDLLHPLHAMSHRQMKAGIRAIEREAHEEAERLVGLIEAEGVVTWGDERHRARFLDNLDSPEHPSSRNTA